MATHRLGSSAAIHTPGIIAWAINGYAFEADQQSILNCLCGGFPTVPRADFEALLSKAVPYSVEGETVVFEGKA